MKTRTIKKNIQEKVTDWLSTLPAELAEKVQNKVVVTGGCIASMLLREPVNDYDAYFKDVKSAILVTQHYCNKWIEDNKEAPKAGHVVKPIKPTLKLTFTVDSFPKYQNYFGSNSVLGYNEPTIVVEADDLCLTEFLQTKADWSNCERVEIFIKSAGSVGNNPDDEKEYDYFETRPAEDAVEYLDKNIVNEHHINGPDKGKYNIIFMSSNAITLSDKMQLVIRFFGEPSQIHDTYDFVHATNYWTKKGGLVTNVRALEALLARELIYAGSKYPLASIFRTRKFIKREWSCHVGNFIKMAMQLNDLDLTDTQVLEEQLTGVDAAYMHQIIRAVKDKKKSEPDFEFNSSYICELVDRMMGISGEEKEDFEDLGLD